MEGPKNTIEKSLDIDLNKIVEKELKLYKDILIKLESINLDFKEFSRITPKFIKKLNKFDKMLSTSSSEMTVSAIMHPLTLDLYRKFENFEECKPLSEEERNFEKQKRFYSKLYEALTLCHILTEEFYDYYKKKEQ